MHLGAAAHGGNGCFERATRQPVFAHELAGLALIVGDSKQEHLARDERVAQLLRFLVGLIEKAGELTAQLDVAVGALHLRQARDGFVDSCLQGLNMHARTREQRARGAILLRNQRREHMHGLEILVAPADGDALRVGQGFLKFGGEFVDSHEETSNLDYHQHEGRAARFKRGRSN